jgi:hypothetical protein
MIKSLRTISENQSFVQREIDGREISIENLNVQFSFANPKYLIDTNLSKTYLSKPLVRFKSESLFGELAILRYLQMDGWDGVWVDTFHGRGVKKVFWSGMPPEGSSRLPKHAESLYDKIVDENGMKSSGFFDVFAWKDRKYIFIEYKGKGDSSNQNEKRWIKSALKCGIKLEQLFFASY